MAELINLNKARKARSRVANAAMAAQNRVLHGLSGAQKKAARAQRDKDDARLEGRRLDAPPLPKAVDE